MGTGARRALYWTPRALGILLALFLSLFAMDVFNEGYGFGETVLALLMHLVPVYLVVVALVVAWHWEWIGAILFTGLAFLYLILSGGRQHWAAYATISGPLLLMGVLFLLNWRYRRQLRTS
ncbi:MAG: hypothetical protein GF355_03830 [Candidatus Eisenbacteria bacterium]|nr:hypothetical protein [Candidatus Eisenbacteria bacterium]